MKNHITIVGNIVAAPERRRTGTGETIASFRVACNPHYFKDGRWHDGEPSFYSVSAFRHLAENVLASLSQGQRVIVAGSLRIRPWNSGEKQGVSADIDAEAVGPDLLFGRARFERAAPASPRTAEQSPADLPPTDADAPATDETGWAMPGGVPREQEPATDSASELVGAAVGAAGGAHDETPF